MLNENRIYLSSAKNSRFIGDRQSLIRSDAVLSFTDDDTCFLKQCNIGNIIDLRSDKEVLYTPCLYPGSLRYRHIPLHENGILPTAGDAVGKFYFSMAKAEQPVYAVLKAIADSDTGTIFFCRSGKDRTGIVSALILGLCGFSDTYIAEDYAVSGIHLKQTIDSWLPHHPEYERDAVTPLRKHILSFLQCIREHYGSVYHYYRCIGLKENDMDRIRIKVCC